MKTIELSELIAAYAVASGLSGGDSKTLAEALIFTVYLIGFSDEEKTKATKEGAKYLDHFKEKLIKDMTDNFSKVDA